MADNSSNILKQLQEHEITPPANAFNKAWEEILLQKEDILDSDKEEKKAFTQLQEYNMRPPVLDLKAVMAGDKKDVAKPTVPFLKNLMRVAAVSVIVAAGVAVYMLSATKDNGLVTTSPGIIKDTTLYNASGNETGTTNNKPGENSLAVKITENEQGNIILKKTRGAGSKLSTAAKRNVLTYKGAGGFYNDDIFFTLVNYKEYGKDKLFAKTIKDKRVTLNEYSYVNLSDKMTEMLQELYITKKNGRPARKAKKAKKKFDKWRKKDEKHFDRNMQKNPADIIDLSDWIL